MIKNTTLFNIETLTHFQLAQRALQHKQNKFRFILVTVSLAVMIVSWYFIISSEIPFFLLMLLLFYGLIYLLNHNKYLLKKRYQKYYQKKIGANQAYGYDIFYEFSAESIAIIKPNMNIIVQWAGIKHVKEDDLYFYIYINDLETLIVQKTGFTVGTSQEFMQLMFSKGKFEI